MVGFHVSFFALLYSYVTFRGPLSTRAIKLLQQTVILFNSNDKNKIMFTWRLTYGYKY